MVFICWSSSSLTILLSGNDISFLIVSKMAYNSNNYNIIISFVFVVLLLVGTGRGRVMLQQSYLKVYCCVSWNVLIQHSRIIVVLLPCIVTPRKECTGASMHVCVCVSKHARAQGRRQRNKHREKGSNASRRLILSCVWCVSECLYRCVCARSVRSGGQHTRCCRGDDVGASVSNRALTHTLVQSSHPCRVHRQ